MPSSDKKPSWTAPQDMSPDQVAACLAGKMCGARIKNVTTHRYCRQRPAPGQTGGMPHRCRRHGGCGGPPPGTRNALKHGIYTEILLPGEEALYEELSVDGLDHEIKITKLRLFRAFKAERRQQQLLQSDSAADQDKALQLESSSKRLANGRAMEAQISKRTVDYGTVIHSLISQVAKLLNQKAVLRGENITAPEDQARRVRELLAKMDACLDRDGDMDEPELEANP